jgi:hypothetical protein
MFLTLDIVPSIFEVVRSKKLELIPLTFLTTLGKMELSFSHYIIQIQHLPHIKKPKPHLSSHTRNKNEKECEGLEVRRMFT